MSLKSLHVAEESNVRLFDAAKTSPRTHTPRMLSGDKREKSVTGKQRTAQFLLKYYEVDQSNQGERWSVC